MSRTAYVMIVDDDEEFAGAVAVALRQEGHEVAVRTDTAAALTMMRNHPPDLVILDVMFPEDDFAGFELARAMRQCGSLKRIPILMLTGVNDKLLLNFTTLDLDDSWLPVSDFLDKPVDVDQLASKAKALLQPVVS